MDLNWPPGASLPAAAEYDDYAAVYDLLHGDQTPDVDFYLRAAAAAVPPGGSVLELGVGTGRLTAHLLRAGYRVVGVDASEAMLRQARRRLAGCPGEVRLVAGTIEAMALGERFALAVAPFGMVAHLLSDATRQAAFGAVAAHLLPGGSFVYDDRPGWLAPATASGAWEVRREVLDPETGYTVRLVANLFEAADQPCTIEYDILDWLAGERVVRRAVVRFVYRDIPLPLERQFLAAAGFAEVEVCGGFDGRPFQPADLAANDRLILWCRRPHD